MSEATLSIETLKKMLQHWEQSLQRCHDDGLDGEYSKVTREYVEAFRELLEHRIREFPQLRIECNQAKNGNMVTAIAMNHEISPLEKICLLTKDALVMPCNQSMEVIESLPQHDEYLALAQDRRHLVDDTQSLAKFTLRYGDPKESIIFCNKDRFVLVVNDSLARGMRECVVLPLAASQDWTDWANILGKPITHREMMRYLMAHEHNLCDATILAAMSSLKVNSKINFESDVQEDKENIGFFVKTEADEELKRFPKSFNLVVPVWQQDVTDNALWRNLKIRLEVKMPSNTNEAISFILHCSELTGKIQARVEAEMTTLRKLLWDSCSTGVGAGEAPTQSEMAARACESSRTEWLILAGAAAWEPKRLGAK